MRAGVIQKCAENILVRLPSDRAGFDVQREKRGLAGERNAASCERLNLRIGEAVDGEHLAAAERDVVVAKIKLRRAGP